MSPSSAALGTFPERPGRTASATWWLKIEPRAAMPVAMPTCRKVEFAPLAMPARSTGTTPTAVDASGGLISPMPMPETIRPGIRWVQEESVWMPWISSSPTPRIRKPGAISHFTGTFSVSRPATAAATKEARGEEQEPQTRLHGGVVEDVLHVDHQEREQREDRGRDAEGSDQAAGEGGLAQQRHVEHRGALDELADHEDTTRSTPDATSETTTCCSLQLSWPASISP